MKKFPPFFWVAIVSALFIPCAAWAADKPAFTGAKKCSMCHKTEDQGRQYAIWLESRHAKAFETLGTPRARELGKTWQVTDPQKSGKCLKCHSTAYAFTESRVSMDIAVEEGVSCESCHGPGSGYAKKSIMKDRAASQAAGMLMPNEQTCTKCHGAGGPVKENFDFKKSWEKIKHGRPKR